MGQIENIKIYSGNDLETIFFRPMLVGQNAEELGIRVLYNMPVPTTIQLWSPQTDILQPYSTGWSGGDGAQRVQKTLELCKVKAEVGFSASDYFSQVYELITNRADVNLDDLTGSELEQAETEMFRAAVAENLRLMMWAGDTGANSYNLFDGLLKKVHCYEGISVVDFSAEPVGKDNVISLLTQIWEKASPRLKSLKAEGQLAYFVSTDVCDAYEQYLDSLGADGAYTELTTGRRELSFHGIKLIDINISHIMPLHHVDNPSFCVLTDRRNLVLAVNTADYPGSEVRMWYNPDEMQNRQRAIFMAGCELLDEELVVRADFN